MDNAANDDKDKEKPAFSANFWSNSAYDLEPSSTPSYAPYGPMYPASFERRTIEPPGTPRTDGVPLRQQSSNKQPGSAKRQKANQQTNNQPPLNADHTAHFGMGKAQKRPATSGINDKQTVQPVQEAKPEASFRSTTASQTAKKSKETHAPKANAPGGPNKQNELPTRFGK